MTINQYYCRKTSNFGRILEKLIPNSRSYAAITSCRASKFDFFSCSLHCGYFFRSWMCFRVSHICSKILINSLTGTKCPRRLYHSPIYLHLIVIRRASAKLENSFVTANFASARAQLSKLERQRAILQNCGQIINKQQLFIFPNSLTIHQTPPLHNTFYFSNTWTKIQLRSDPVNMQPDETKCYPQRPITTLWPAACKMLSTSSGSPPLNSGTLSLHMERNCRIRRGAAGYWNVTLATTRRQALSWEPRSKLGHENRRALEPENSAESEHYSLSLTPVIPVRLFFARMKSNPAHARIIQ